MRRIKADDELFITWAARDSFFGVEQASQKSMDMQILNPKK